MRLIVGLGNPGPRYASTRHNIGFMVVDHLAAGAGAVWQDHSAQQSLAVEAQVAGQAVGLVKPQTFMNRSGLAVTALTQLWGVAPEDALIVFDDFLLDFGRLRLRRQGSDGGHNGLASVLAELGTRQVPRLRLGIGEPPAEEEIIDYVLDPFGPGQQVEALIERGAAAVEAWLSQGLDAAMNSFNGCEPLE